MRTVRRMFYREIGASVAFVAVAFLSLSYFIDFVDELQRVGRRGYTAWQAAITALTELPGNLYELMPFAVIDRPGWTLRAMHSRGALALQRHRIDETDAGLLAELAPPAWVFLHGPRSSLSSTVIRQQRSQLFGSEER